MKKGRNESGIYLIIMAAASFVLVAMCALAIGLGYISFNRTIHQDSANLAALAAIEEYVRTAGTYQQKTDQALIRANYILSQNRLKGVSAPLGDLGQAPNGGVGGTLIFGTWYESDPGISPPPCGTYPCFLQNPAPNVAGASTTANAVKIETHNQTGVASNAILLPFSHILGKDYASVTSDSLAIMVPRCLALLLDVSGSISGTTHTVSGLHAAPYSAPPPQYVTSPSYASLFAYRANSINAGTCSSIGSLEKMLWCNQVNHGLLTRPSGSPVDPLFHYRSDYHTHPSSVGDVYIDSLYDPAAGYYGPEPYSTVFKAFNAVTRLLTQQASVGDQALMLVFTGQILDRIPPASGLTNEFGLLAQLTNLMNIGLYNRNGASVSPRVLPNMVYRGWIPLYGNDAAANGTNIPLALYQAINEIANNCPATAKKAIILASDGISTCNATSPSYTPNCTQPYYDRYNDARAEILGPIRTQLQQRQISFSYILAGGSSGANFMNRPNPEWPVPPNDPDDPRRFLTPEQAISRGFGGTMHDPAHRFFDESSYNGTTPATPSDAFANIGTAGWVFGDPNGVLGELAFSTGGVPCPLMPTGSASDYYDHDGDQHGASCSSALCTNCTPCVLRSSRRTSNAAQRVAVEWKTQAEIAAACAVKAIGEDPFALREVPGGSN